MGEGGKFSKKAGNRQKNRVSWKVERIGKKEIREKNYLLKRIFPLGSRLPLIGNTLFVANRRSAEYAINTAKSALEWV